MFFLRVVRPQINLDALRIIWGEMFSSYLSFGDIPTKNLDFNICPTQRLTVSVKLTNFLGQTEAEAKAIQGLWMQLPPKVSTNSHL